MLLTWTADSGDVGPIIPITPSWRMKENKGEKKVRENKKYVNVNARGKLKNDEVLVSLPKHGAKYLGFTLFLFSQALKITLSFQQSSRGRKESLTERKRRRKGNRVKGKMRRWKINHSEKPFFFAKIFFNLAFFSFFKNYFDRLAKNRNWGRWLIQVIKIDHPTNGEWELRDDETWNFFFLFSLFP